MLEKAFNDVYTKFKLHFYQNVFQRFATREATPTTVESFCMEGIMAMGGAHHCGVFPDDADLHPQRGV